MADVLYLWFGISWIVFCVLWLVVIGGSDGRDR